MMWREYHDRTKHSAESLRRSRHFLDWANMPEPFRHYEGAPLLDLPADPPEPEIPALSVLGGAAGEPRVGDGAEFLSRLLYYSAAVSASKRSPSGTRYALRVNPSSGNLHPTEFHFVTRGLRGWPDGLYHYRPSDHTAEQRAEGSFAGLPDAPLVFVLTTIAWREAWKYRDRAYRYCLHDTGHAWESLALAARAIGCEVGATGDFDDDALAAALRLSADEWPMLILTFRGAGLPLAERSQSALQWRPGEPNRLSPETVPYPLIDRFHEATKVRDGPAEMASFGAGSGSGGAPFGRVVRLRRSALDFIGGARQMRFSELHAILAATGHPRFISLRLYVHRVEGMEPGVYRYCPETRKTEKVREGDQRVIAAALSLQQELAGNSCVTCSMAGNPGAAAERFGDRGYRYVFFEAGAIGQRMYVAAHALGLGATGIGAFFDDEVHRYLGIETPEQQVVYHFAIGYPVPDPRLDG